MNDLTGRKQFTRNVLITWTSHLFIILAGFILPRQINDSLGPEALGIWDLSWATVRYFSLTSLGFGSSLTRYSALYTAQNDFQGLSKAFTAVVILQVLVAIIIVSGTSIFSWTVPFWMEFPDAVQQQQAQAVIVLLGISLAIKMLSTPAGGLVSGAHRWDIQNALGAGQDFTLALIMISVMLLGGGLVQLAWVAVIVSVCITGLNHYLACRLAPNAKFHFKYWEWKTTLEMTRFGVKTVLSVMPNILVFQTLAIVLAGQAGPAVLAVFNRGAALVRHCHVVIRKMAMMFTPMTSGLVGIGQKKEAKAQLIKAGCYSFCITFPIALVLFWYGDLFLLLWMGSGYDNHTMLMILVAGSILPISQSGTTSVLAGFNAHGKVAIYSLVTTVVALAISIPIANYVGWSAVTAAAVAGFSWTAGKGLVIQYYLRRFFNISSATYLWGTVLFPLICNIPLTICMAAGRFTLAHQYWLATVGIWLLGTGATALIYWKWILDADIRESILNKLFKRRAPSNPV